MKKLLSLLAYLTLATFVNIGHAATLFWSGDGITAGGAGSWNTTTTNPRWGTAAGGPFNRVWTNALVDTARFTAASVPTVGTVTVNLIQTDVSGITFASGTITFSGTGAGIFANHASGVTTMSSTYTGNVLNKSGAGKVELNAAANTIAKYNVTGGFVNIAAINRLGAAAPALPASLVSDYFTLNGGGLSTSIATGDIGSTRGFTIGAAGGFLGASGAANALTISAPIVGSSGGSLTITSGAPFYSPQNAAGNWILSNTGNTWDGATVVAAGTLTLGTNGVIPDTSDVTVSGGVFALNGMTEAVDTLVVSGGTVSGSGTLTGSAYDFRSGTVSSVLSGGAAATKTTGGSIDLSGAQLFNGGFTHSAGTVRVNSTTALGAANSAVVLANGVTLATTSTTARTLTYAFTLNGTVTLGQASSGTAAVTLAGTLDLGSSTRTININNLSDTISANVSGSGGIAVNQNNQSVSSATVTSGGTGYLASSTVVTFNNTGTGGSGASATVTTNAADGAILTQTRRRSRSPVPAPAPLALSQSAQNLYSLPARPTPMRARPSSATASFRSMALVVWVTKPAH
jgi:fibronectin-binding autotransporter adhesin